jgi:hypothetical protein
MRTRSNFLVGCNDACASETAPCDVCCLVEPNVEQSVSLVNSEKRLVLSCVQYHVDPQSQSIHSSLAKATVLMSEDWRIVCATRSLARQPCQAGITVAA